MKINVVLYQPEIPNNTGNIVRICKATGAKLHLIGPLGFDTHPRLLKRAAAGRRMSDIEHEIHVDYDAFQRKYSAEKIVYLTRYGLTNYANYDFSKHKKEVWLMFGRESDGLPKTILQTAPERCLRIPMQPASRSLNLANSVMLLTYEVHRQTGFENLLVYEDQKGADWLLK
ncbi:tRNA (cytidine(34)-2'-O)-methyltransferase [Mycoplasma sp. ATU-Cv-508]|uniref:TrmH family RNA methyltransferase n=1 Tax=Mycoplasma sp. ATU-Cv-508 TaxID=2048001 RepID=UPI000FDEBD56